MSDDAREQAEDILTRWDGYYELVALVAAAIDHVTANSSVPESYDVMAWDMDADTFRALRRALSALGVEVE